MRCRCEENVTQFERKVSFFTPLIRSGLLFFCESLSFSFLHLALRTSDRFKKGEYFIFRHCLLQSNIHRDPENISV